MVQHGSKGLLLRQLLQLLSTRMNGSLPWAYSVLVWFSDPKYVTFYSYVYEKRRRKKKSRLKLLSSWRHREFNTVSFQDKGKIRYVIIEAQKLWNQKVVSRESDPGKRKVSSRVEMMCQSEGGIMPWLLNTCYMFSRILGSEQNNGPYFVHLKSLSSIWENVHGKKELQSKITCHVVFQKLTKQAQFSGEKCHLKSLKSTISYTLLVYYATSKDEVKGVSVCPVRQPPYNVVVVGNEAVDGTGRWQKP